MIQEDGKSPRSKRKRDVSESSNDDTDDERPRKRGRPPVRHKETFKGFSDVEVKEMLKLGFLRRIIIFVNLL